MPGLTVEGMEQHNEIREFLTSRRARLTPEQVGLRSYGRRRVPGLRRDEVAQLAEISVEYYSRLERGNLKGVSESVLQSLTRALRLDDTEERHLRHLMRAAKTSIRQARQPAARTGVRPSVQRMLNAMTTIPAVVQNSRLDILATNQLGRAFYLDHWDNPTGTANHARFIFLDPRGRDFAPDWDAAAADVVALLRTAAGRDPLDRNLSDLIGELSTRSDEFRTRWGAHNVLQQTAGAKQVSHRIVGDITVEFDALELLAEPGTMLYTYSAEPGSPSEDSLQLLASWAASNAQALTQP
jgi:transcriptional regulator with XRE-family HTH domain